MVWTNKNNRNIGQNASDKRMHITKRRRSIAFSIIALVIAVCASCSVSYKFNGASIDYSIADFPIRSSYVWGPMGPMFNNKLKDEFANNTRLIQVKRNGDLKIEGEITQYSQRNKSVSSDGHSAQTELSITVNVRFTNNTNQNSSLPRRRTKQPRASFLYRRNS